MLAQNRQDVRFDQMFLPLSKDEWDVVLEKHNQKFKEFFRNVYILKRNFSTLYRKTMSTGVPLMTDDVCRAKILRNIMTERADTVVSEEVENLVESFMPSSRHQSATENKYLRLQSKSPDEKMIWRCSHFQQLSFFLKS